MSRETLWQRRFQSLLLFKNREGHCEVPRRYSDDPSLVEWIKTQRKQYRLAKEGKQSSMTAERTDALEAIGFTWRPQKQTSASWRMHFEELNRFKLQKGHCEVPRNYSQNPTLGNWVKEQRKQYMFLKKGKPSYMTTVKKEALDYIGFTWQIKGDKSPQWMMRYEELRQFQLQKDHCDVPQKYSENPSLGKWVHKQRGQYKSMKNGKPSAISEERIRKLDDIGFIWKIR